MKEYVFNTFDEMEKEIPLHESFNEKLVETAGFIPLEVRLKQLEQQGYVARFAKADFTSDDMRVIWLDPENEILPGDDMEDIARKQNARSEIIKSIMMSKNVDSETSGDKNPLKEETKIINKEETL